MSTAAIAYRDLQCFPDGYEPVSQGSKTVHEQWAQFKNYLQGSATDWWPVVDAALREIRRQCSIEDWDGQGALPVPHQVIEATRIIVEILFSRLPKGTPAPDVIPEADGEICLSWIFDSMHMFALSIGAHKKINFSGQFGREDSVHDWQPVDTSNHGELENSLQNIIEYVEKIYAPSTKRRRP